MSDDDKMVFRRMLVSPCNDCFERDECSSSARCGVEHKRRKEESERLRTALEAMRPWKDGDEMIEPHWSDEQDKALEVDDE